MATYQDLEYRDVNGNKTVFNKLTGQGYQTPEQLAGDLGVQSPDINWGAITAKDLTPATSITLPTVTDTSQDSQAILAGTKTEAQMIADQMAKRAAELKAEQDASKGNPLTEFLKSSGEAQDESGSAMDLYKSLYQSPEYTALETEKSTQKQLYNTAKNEFNMVQAKINAINAQADAIPLQIQQEFQGRGATAGGVAPIQTARLREVAIQALALQPALYAAQAKMANAQGDYQAAQDNLTEATSRMDKYFTALLADRNDKLDYKNRLIDKVYDYSTKKEQQQLDAIKDKNNKDFEIQKLNMQRMKELANTATNNFQGSLATQIAQLDPSSPTFQQDLANLQGQINIVQETWSAPYLMGGDYVQKNSKTGEIRVAVNVDKGGGGSGGGGNINPIDPKTGRAYDFNNPEVVATLPVSTLTKAVIGGYGTVKDLTPTDKAMVIGELYKVGYDPKKYVLDKLEALVNQLEKVPEGQRGLVQGLVPARFYGGDATEFESAKIVLTRQLARLYDVGMLSDQDVKDYKNAMPSRGDRNIEASRKAVQGLKAAIGTPPKTETGKTIRVKQKSTGQTGTIPESEFNPNLYEKI